MTDPRLAPFAAAHAIVCRVRPDGMQHAFVFDPQGILSDCRYLLAALLPDWCEHSPEWVAMANGALDIAAQQATEIARLRKIEEAAREYRWNQSVTARDALDAVLPTRRT